MLKGEGNDIKDLLKDVVCLTTSGKIIKPKTVGQKRYLDSIRTNDIVFGIGPAGTGKTYLAMAMAVQALKNKEVNRIIRTRPAVEDGENLGFLPGYITQVDLPRVKDSGLKTAAKVLDDVERIDFIYLSKNDIVRHPLVRRIIEAYEKFENVKD